MIKFYNIKTKETRVAETEPMIAAFWASSDRGPNAHVGQDFGWRLAPETVVAMRKLQKDPEAIRQIAQNFQKLPENVNEADFLKHLSDSNSDVVTGMDQSDQDFSREYEDEIRKLEDAEEAVKTTENNEDAVESSKASKPNKPSNNEGESNGKKANK